jgi:hypothetical protein
MVPEKSIGALKALVILLGLAILVGLGALAFGVAAKLSDNDQQAAGPGAARPAGVLAPFDVRLPAGARVLEMDLGGDRLAVRLDLGNGREAIHVFDIRSGATLGVVQAP